MYFTGVSNPKVVALHHPDIGLMCQPGNRYDKQIPLYPAFAADNGCFGVFDERRWLVMLDRVAMWQELCVFAVVPDSFDRDNVASNHRRTLDRWYRYRDEVKDRGLPAAFVCQDGCTPDDIPPDADAVFIGGTTEYKLSELAWACCAAAKARGKWAHLGRCNSAQRTRAASLACDSVDGTYLKHSPDVLLPKLVSWLDRLHYQPHLAMFGAA